VVSPVQATDDPSRIGKVDVVLVGVKAWQLQEIASVLPLLVGPSTCVVPLQNGLEAPAQLAEMVGIQHVLGGTCAIYSYRSAPGCIRHIGLEPSVTIGEVDATSSPRTARSSSTAGCRRRSRTPSAGWKATTSTFARTCSSTTT
jgi:2-dehydropantoate 2-reductase